MANVYALEDGNWAPSQPLPLANGIFAEEITGRWMVYLVKRHEDVANIYCRNRLKAWILLKIIGVFL